MIIGFVVIVTSIGIVVMYTISDTTARWQWQSMNMNMMMVMLISIPNIHTIRSSNSSTVVDTTTTTPQ